MKIFLIIVAVIAILSVCSCQFWGVTIKAGNGISTETPVSVSDFDAISSKGSTKVVYFQTEGEQSVVLTCDENLVEYYDIGVEGNTLVVKTKPGVALTNRVETFVTVKSPRLNGLSVSGSGNCTVATPVFSGGDVSLKVSGSGSLYAGETISCKGFSSSVSGSGRMKIGSVMAESAQLRGSGSGSTSIGSITADGISASFSGSGGLQLVCEDCGDIDVSLTGSGAAHISGNARSLKSHTAGSGRVDAQRLSLR